MNRRTNMIILFVVIGLLFLGGYYFLSGSLARQTAPQSAQTNSTTTENISPKEFTLSVVNRKLVAGDSTLQVSQGDMVAIHIMVDEDEELHLHGYDVHIDLEKNQQGTLTLTASSSGRFPFELEHSGTELGALEVAPR